MRMLSLKCVFKCVVSVLGCVWRYGEMEERWRKVCEGGERWREKMEGDMERN